MLKIAFWSVFSVAIVSQMICVAVAARTDEPVWQELVVGLIGFIVMLCIAVADSFDRDHRQSAGPSFWLGLTVFVTWQVWIYPMAFILYLNLFHSERGWVWTDGFGGEILLLEEHWKTRGYDPQYGGQASAHPPWIDK